VELHTNEEFAKRTPFGRRVAHGALVFSISIGLATRTNLLDDALLAFAGVDKLRFVAPVFIGDTVHVTKRVTERKELGAEQGTVVFETRVVNQRNELVLVYFDKMLMKRRPGASATAT
jgi:acyl dehydratase